MTAENTLDCAKHSEFRDMVRDYSTEIRELRYPVDVFKANIQWTVITALAWLTVAKPIYEATRR